MPPSHQKLCNVYIKKIILSYLKLSPKHFQLLFYRIKLSVIPEILYVVCNWFDIKQQITKELRRDTKPPIIIYFLSRNISQQ